MNPKSDIRHLKSPPVIGLVGGVGAGKSTVAQMMAGEGCAVVDADAIAHAVLREDDVKSRVRETFGPRVFGPDGAVDRGRLADVVFADSGRREALERIVHPRILARIDAELAAARAAGPRAVALDAPLILEKGLANRCDYVVYIRASAEMRQRRLQQVKGWAPSEVQRRDASQVSLKTKRDRADYSIDNSASPEHTLTQVRRILAQVDAQQRP